MDLKWIAEQLDRPGYSQVGLARALGKDAAAVNRMLKGERQIKVNEVPAILGYLKAVPPDNDSPLSQAIQPLPNLSGERAEVPVWASAEAGSDGAMVLVSEPIDYIRRSERMQGVRNPFAFYVIGSSMSPAIEHGTQVVINPSLLPMAERDHVFIQDLPDGTMKAMVKRLIRSTERSWRVRQFNELKDFDLLRTIWSKAYRITEKRED